MTPADDVLRAIAEPRRREILSLLAHEELPVGRLADAFDVSRSAVSQHLRVLADAGLVSYRSVGTRHYYRARPQGLAELRTFLEETWSASLDVARRIAEEDAGVVGAEGVDRASA